VPAESRRACRESEDRPDPAPPAAGGVRPDLRPRSSRPLRCTLPRGHRI